MTLTFNQIISSIFLIGFIAVNLPAIPKFIRELLFYRANAWDFAKKSSNRVVLQEPLSQKFSFLPIGVLKLLVLSTQIGFVCAPFLAILQGYLSQKH